MQTKSDLMLALSEATASLEQVGEKGASLARMAAAGLPVAPGFHITTAAHRQFVVESDLQPQIVAALQPADPVRPATLEAASQAIRDRFARARVPPQVAGAIAQACARRGLGHHVHRPPDHGQREQAVISAAWGLGETVAGGTVTPDTLTVDKASGQAITVDGGVGLVTLDEE